MTEGQRAPSGSLNLVVVDSNLPRFSQGLQAVLLALAFVLDTRWIVPVLAAALIAAAVGGPRWNVFAYLYGALPIPAGPPEPAAPPRFAQTLGAIFLTVGSVALFTATPESGPWWTLGWGPALMVAVLAGLAASTSL
jgi:hypothetical protein